MKKEALGVCILIGLWSQLGLSMPPQSDVAVSLGAWNERLRLGIDAPVRTMATSDTLQIPVVCIQYPDFAYLYGAASFDSMLFAGPWTPGTASQYYADMSYGQLSLAGSVHGWYTSDSSRAYYGYDNGNGWDEAARLVREAAAASDPYVDYSIYDNDGDGYVDNFSVIHAGRGCEETGDGADVWSHRWFLSAGESGPYVTDDGVTIDSYTIEPERSSWTNHGSMVSIGVFCHEWGHALGLPDLYDTQGSGEGLGNWCLMAAGSWGGNGTTPYYPASLCAWGKTDVAWITPTVVDSNYTYTIPAGLETCAVYQLWTEGTPGSEYFLIENRYRFAYGPQHSIQWDKYARASGLLIYHIDEDIIASYRSLNQVNSNTHAYGVAIEETDASADLYSAMDLFLGSNRGDAYDVWSAGTQLNFDSTGSVPSTKSNDGVTQTCGVNQISSSGEVMTAFFYTRAGEEAGFDLVAAPVYLSGYPGDTVSTVLHLTPRLGYPYPVTLSFAVEPVPSVGTISDSLSVNPLTAADSSVLYIFVSPEVPPDSYRVLVMGAGGGAVEETTEVILELTSTGQGHSGDQPAPDHPVLAARAAPNPFRESTRIEFALPSPAGHATLTIWNLLGQRVRELRVVEAEAGRHQVVWDGRDSRGQRVQSGVYWFRVEAGSERGAGLMTLMR